MIDRDKKRPDFSLWPMSVDELLPPKSFESIDKKPVENADRQWPIGLPVLPKDDVNKK
ncbi:MAG: hypothetical protein ACK5GV_01185 [Bacteroidota bacterium]|jgi:hypothetical protein